MVTNKSGHPVLLSFRPFPSGSQQEHVNLIDAITFRTCTRRKNLSIASSLFAIECNSSRCSLPRAFLHEYHFKIWISTKQIQFLTKQMIEKSDTITMNAYHNWHLQHVEV